MEETNRTTVCPACGTENSADSFVCKNCSAILNVPVSQTVTQEAAPQQPVYQQPGTAPQGVPTDKADYLKNYSSASFKKNINIWCIVAYVIAGLNAILSLIGNVSGLLDVAIIVALTIGIHTTKSKACAIGMIAYGVINMIVLYMAYGTFGGWLWLLFGIAMVSAIGKEEKKYNEYMASRGNPTL